MQTSPYFQNAKVFLQEPSTKHFVPVQSTVKYSEDFLCVCTLLSAPLSWGESLLLSFVRHASSMSFRDLHAYITVVNVIKLRLSLEFCLLRFDSLLDIELCCYD